MSLLLPPIMRFSFKVCGRYTKQPSTIPTSNLQTVCKVRDPNSLLFTGAYDYIETQNSLFWDTIGNGFFSTQAGQADIIIRLKDGMHNAEPSTNAVSASNLYRLGSLLEDQNYTGMARKTCQAFATEIIQHPFLHSSMMSSVVAGRLGMRSVVISGNGPDVDLAVRTSRSRLKPNTTVIRLGGIAKTDWLIDRTNYGRWMLISQEYRFVNTESVETTLTWPTLGKH